MVIPIKAYSSACMPNVPIPRPMQGVPRELESLVVHGLNFEYGESSTQPQAQLPILVPVLRFPALALPSSAVATCTMQRHVAASHSGM